MEKAEAQATARDPFFGRQDELQVLQRSLAEVGRGRQQAALVAGSSGIGKTALLHHFLDASAHEADGPKPMLVLRTRCYEREPAPLKPVVGLLTGLVRELRAADGDPLAGAALSAAPELVDVFPALGALGLVQSGDARAARSRQEPLDIRRRAWGALRELFGHLAQTYDLALFVDDLHWADEDSLELLLSLSGGPEPPPLLFLATYRREVGTVSERFGSFVEELAARDDAVTLSLDPLSTEDSERLVSSLLKHSAPGDSDHWANVVARVVREAEGNPLLLEEMVRYLRAQLGDADAQARATALEAVRLEDVLRKRVSALPPPVREVLELVAVAGDPVPQAVILFGLGSNAAGTGWQEWVTRLRVESLIRRHGQAAEDELNTFHDRLRESIVSDLSTERRQELHRRLAEAMEQFDPDRVDFLAKHWEGAGEKERAKPNVLRLARRSARTLAFARAAELYKQALDLEDDERARSALWRSHGEAQANLGRLLEAGRAFLAAAEHAPENQRLALRLSAASQLLRGGHIAQGSEVVRELLGELGMPMAKTSTRALLSVLRSRAMLWLRGLELKPLRDDADTESERTVLDALYVSSIYLSVIDTIHGADLQNRYLRRALNSGHEGHAGLALAEEGGHLASVGKADAGRRLCERGANLAEALDDPRRRCVVQVGWGMLEYFGGRWKAALERLQRAERELLELGHDIHWELATARTWHSFSLIQLGELERLVQRYDEHVTEALRFGNHYAAANMRTRLNIVWMIRDDLEHAQEDVSYVLDTYPEGSFQVQHFWHLHGRCELLCYLGRGAEALALLDEEVPRLRKAQLHRVQMVRSEITSLYGRAALNAAHAASGPAERKRALKIAAQAAKRLRKEGKLYSRGWGALIDAGVVQQRGEAPEQIRAALEQAVTLLDECDSVLFAQAARRRLGELDPGAEGARLVGEMDDWFRERGVQNVRRFLQLMAPGLGDGDAEEVAP